MKPHLKTASTYFVIVLMLPFFVIGLILSAYTVVNGQLPPGAIGVFGGRIGEVIQCTCSGGAVISVGGPRPGRFRFVPGASLLYEYGQIKSIGVWVLGNYSTPTPCKVLVCPCGFLTCCCAIVPHKGNIQIVGTSLTGGDPPLNAPKLNIVLPDDAFTQSTTDGVSN